jgi:hypothetical protein
MEKSKGTPKGVTAADSKLPICEIGHQARMRASGRHRLQLGLVCDREALSAVLHILLQVIEARLRSRCVGSDSLSRT